MLSETRTTTRLRLLALTAGCIAVLGLAACGGDDETTSSSSTTTAPTGTTGADTTNGGDGGDLPEASTLREQFNQQLMQILTSTQGLSEAQAQCAVDELETRISDEEIQQAISDAAQTGQAPQDLIDEAYDAGAKCSGK